MPSSLQAESSGRRQSGCDSKHCGSLDSNMPDSLSVKRLLLAGGLHTHTHTHTLSLPVSLSHTHTHTHAHTHTHTKPVKVVLGYITCIIHRWSNPELQIGLRTNQRRAQQLLTLTRPASH